MHTGAALDERVRRFVQDVVDAMGLGLEVTVDRQADHLRIALSGEGGDVLLRRKGEALEALQYVVNTTFRRDVDGGQRLVVDYRDFRRARDRELRQMARFLIERLEKTGEPQSMGPLNSYARRLVHLEVAEHPGAVSESQGDGATKVVIISRRREPAPSARG